MSIRSDNASACTQGGEVSVDDIVVRTSYAAALRFLADKLFQVET